jgi:uncharacterized protein with NRDE domain
VIYGCETVYYLPAAGLSQTFAMCLILIAYQSHPSYPLVVVANRDEFYQRPTRDAAFWPEDEQLLAGKDLEGGGTWLGVHRGGRFAAITNHRSPGDPPPAARSRGQIPLDFLRGDRDAAEYATDLLQTGETYAGFNLLLHDDTGLYYCSNISGKLQPLAAGIYGLSNAQLDTPWPKVEQGRSNISELLSRDRLDLEELAGTLANRQYPDDELLPDTGVGLEAERWLAAQFIHSDTYGTRATTCMTLNNNGEVDFLEQRFGAQGSYLGQGRQRFTVSATPTGPGGDE